jgi:iron complex outermembrane receptor protein
MNSKFLAAASLVALAAVASGAGAQTIDYGSLEQLFGEAVTTSATGSPQKVTEAPADMEIITADDIRRSGSRDIPGVLQHVAGINVMRWAIDDADVGVQGYDQADSPRLLVLIDGRQVYADFFGFTPWSTLPVELSEIRQIEVVRGPNSALFGFNAVGGVINIVTYSPLYDNANTVTLLGGTQGLAEGSAVGTVKIGDNAGLRIGVGGRSNDDFSTPQLAASLGTRRGDNRGEINVAATVRLNDKVQVNVEATHSEADEVAQTLLALQDYERYGTDSLKGQVSADTPVGLIQATVYSNWFKLLSFTGTGTTPTVNLNQVTVVQLQDLYKLDSDLTLRAAFEYRHNTATGNQTPGAHVFYDVLSPSAMLDWKVTPDLSFTNALRVDDLQLGRDGFIAPGPFTNASWNQTTIEPSFNSGLVWHADDVDAFRLTAARGVQVPNLVEFGALNTSEPGLFVGGVPTLSPTIVMNYEFGWDRQIPAFDTQVRVSAFHQTTDNINALFGKETISAAGFSLISGSIGSSEADGLLLEFKGKFLQNGRWGFSYTPEVVTDHFDPTADLAGAGTDFQHTTPNHIVRANIGWSAGPWEADLFGQYQSSTFGFVSTSAITEALTPVHDWTSLDARVAYKVTDWATLAIQGQNIGQSPQQQTSGPKVERTVFGSLTVNF